MKYNILNIFFSFSKWILFVVSILLFNCCNKDEEKEILYTPGSGVTDIDGNSYPTVILDNGQEWMAENLRTTRYCNGDTIEQEMDSAALINNTEGGWTFYDFNNSYNEPYGKLYNGYAVNNTAGLCPCGWHVPSNAEWDELISFLGGQEVAGSKMKIEGSNKWDLNNKDATNSSGLSAYPSGYYIAPISKEFRSITSGAFWWSSTEENNYTNWYYYIVSHSSVVSKFQQEFNKISYMSVRCIKN